MARFVLLNQEVDNDDNKKKFPAVDQNDVSLWAQQAKTQEAKAAGKPSAVE